MSAFVVNYAEHFHARCSHVPLYVIN